jgi:antitoxin CptB
MTNDEVDALTQLLDLSDNDLLDLLLGRTEPADSLAVPNVSTLLTKLRQA